MKLIIESWRRFLKESVQEDIDKFLSGINSFDTIEEKLYYIQGLDPLGKGSSRVAYELEDRVLKIAMNEAGIEQNKVEANIKNQQILSPYVVQIYDRDENYLWLLQEKVNTDYDHTDVVWDYVLGLSAWDLQKALTKFEEIIEEPDFTYKGWFSSPLSKGRASKATPSFDEAMDQLLQTRPYSTLKPAGRDLLMRMYRLGLTDIHDDNVGIVKRGEYQVPVILDAGFDSGVDEIFDNHFRDHRMDRTKGIFKPFDASKPASMSLSGPTVVDRLGRSEW